MWAIFLFIHLQFFIVGIGSLSITDKEIDILEKFQVYWTLVDSLYVHIDIDSHLRMSFISLESIFITIK